MTTAEASVLELKELYLSLELVWTPLLCDVLLEKNVVGQRELDLIAESRTHESKTRILLNILRERGSHGQLADLIDALEESKNYRLAVTLRCEMAAERQESFSDPVVEKETATLVYREYGQNLRFSEEDRRVLSQLLCLRSQCARDSWVRQLRAIENRIDCEKRRAQQLEAIGALLSQQIDSFMAEHDVTRRASVHQAGVAGRWQSHSDGPAGMPGLVSSDESIAGLEERVTHLMRSASLCLLAEDKIATEIGRAFCVLDLHPEEAGLEDAITKALERHKREREGRTTRSKSFFSEHVRRLQNLKKFQKAATDAMMEKKKLMLDRANEFKIEKMRLDALKRHTVHVRQRALRAQRAQTDWRARCDYLVKGPRLRRIYERDSGSQGNQPEGFGLGDGGNAEEELHFPPMQYGVVLPSDDVQEEEEKEEEEKEKKEKGVPETDREKDAVDSKGRRQSYVSTRSRVRHGSSSSVASLSSQRGRATVKSLYIQ